MREQAPAAVARTIELRLRDVSQLFNMLDPFPFRERNLSPEAEQYIVEHAEDLPKDQPITIIVHLETDRLDQGDALDLPHAINGWFAARVKDETRAIQTLFRDGQLALLIGLTFLGTCLFVAWLVSLNFEGPVARIFRESFVIVGWVVIWRPAEMFLYDWVPLARRRKLFRRLAAAAVTVKRLPASPRDASAS
ncbi:MAG: hypothetical protein AB7F74_04815 [Parvibaculaceae bacterium]